VVDTAKRLTGEKEESAIVKALSSDPEALLKFQKETPLRGDRLWFCSAPQVQVSQRYCDALEELSP